MPEFKELNTTTEFLTKHIFDQLADAARGNKLGREGRELKAIRVTISESHVARAWYEARSVVSRIAFAVPGDLATPTGGYGYDRRMIAELQKLGWQVDVVLLGEGFRGRVRPKGAAETVLAAVEGRHAIVIDGLAFGVLPEAAAAVRAKRPLVALVHHPLALETGLSAADANAMRASERAALASANAVIVTSPSTARLLVQDYDVAEKLTAWRGRVPSARRCGVEKQGGGASAFHRRDGAAQGLRRSDRRARDACRSALAVDHCRRPHPRSCGGGAARRRYRAA